MTTPKRKKPLPNTNNVPKRVEVLSRQDRVIELMTQGYSEAQVGKKIKEEFGTNPETIKEDLIHARKVFEEKSKEKKEVLRGLYAEMLLDLYRKSYDSEKWSICADIISHMSKINRLYDVDDSEKKILPNVVYLRDRPKEDK